MKRILLILCLTPQALLAEALVATRVIRPQEIITLADMTLEPINIQAGVTDPTLLVGQEARNAIYAGRPIRLGDVGPAAIIERNQVIPLVYQQNGLTISTEGRALQRGAIGDHIRVMNLASRSNLVARIGNDGAVYVGDTP